MRKCVGVRGSVKGGGRSVGRCKKCVGGVCGGGVREMWRKV